MNSDATPASAPPRLTRGDLVCVAGGPKTAGTTSPAPSPDGIVAQLRHLARLHAGGCRRLLIAETPAQPPDPAVVSEAGLAAFAALLASRGLDPVVTRRAGPASSAAAQLAERIAETASGRGFRARLSRLAAPDNGDDPLASLQRIGADHPSALFAALPRIDPTLCTGCDACLTVCPGDVLTQINDTSGETAYAVNGANCDACGLCLEVCAPAAIQLDSMTQTPPPIALHTWTCAACGATVHAPVASPDSGFDTCPTCRRTGHHKKLFQVLT